ncbi:TonB-dependent siderophore receptor [Pseudomonas monteilii]|uniref:TonB-dependent siderophore receptor n=1 Tax=Pseudomonas TaxID=286 RepID=UPI0018E67E6E|nr:MULTISPECIES: TonB-dependent receptor [Pseudomonas]MBI6918843.1 TonB-dependent siderophore receptor [Pseudomonas monteilii]MCE0935799.1 TonB-dependent receptor [Pseudomonas kurunegalensis]
MPTHLRLNHLTRALGLRRVFNAQLPALALSLALPLAAQAQDQQLTLNIPAQPLSAALKAFAEQTDVQVLYEPDAVQNLRSGALSGRYSLDESVRVLLRESGLRYQLRDNTLTLQAAYEGGSAMLLDATSIQSRTLDATTEGTGSYITGSTNTATKLALSPRETPQSVSVVTRRQMDDQNMQSLDDVARAATGINTVKDFGTERSRYFSRGFQVNDLQYDGVPSSISESFSMDVTSVNNMAIYDRVEFVRGANGLMQGAGSPSAAINLVRKRPGDTYQMKAEIGAGSWDNYRGQIDVGGPLNAEGTLRGRTVMLYSAGNSFVDRANKDNQLFYAIGEADLSDWTTVSLGTVLQKDNNGGYDWGGLPTQKSGSFYPFSRSTSFAPGWAHLNKINRTVFGDVRHEFNEDWKLTVNGSMTWSNADFLALYGTNVGNDQLQLRTNDTKYDDEQISLDAALNGAFDLFGRKHELVFGATARKDRFINESRYNNNPTTVDILDFDPHLVATPTYSGERVQYRAVRKDKGVYAATRLNATDDLHVILGSRLSSVKYESPDEMEPFEEKNKIIPYGGIVYDVTDNTSVYASYTEIYQLQANYGLDNKLLSPITGTNYEVGIKNEFLGGRVNTAIALFQVDQSHMPQVISGAQRVCGPTRASSCYEEGGKVRNRGFDIEVGGEVLPQWNVMAGYTYSHPEYVAGARKGTDYSTETAPQRLFKVATNYQLPGRFQDWRVGGNVYHQSKIYLGDVKQSAYNLVDLNTQYKINNNLSVQLNLNNVFDKKYYSSVFNSNLGNYFGAPRNFGLTLRYEN